ncbi:MAG TPA: YIP1 family protein [Candidatus Gracilibacteria bacterium]
MSNLFKLWIHPRLTMRSILEKENPEWLILILFLIAPALWIGLDIGLEHLIPFAEAEPTPLIFYGFAFPFYILFFYLGAWLMSFLGRKIFKAESTAKACRVGVAWTSLASMLIIIPILVIVALIWGGAMLVMQVPQLAPLLIGLGLLLYIGFLVYVTCVMYSALAEALGLVSAWQVLGIVSTIYLAIAVIFISLAGILGTVFFEQGQAFVSNMIMQSMMQGMNMEDMGNMDFSDIEGLENLGNLDLEGIDLSDIDFGDIDLNDINLNDIDQDDIDAFKEYQNSGAEATE